jgi:hypothetical protein
MTRCCDRPVGQALQVRLELDRLFTEADQAGGPAPLIAVCGDFNAASDEVPLQAICGQVEDTGNPAHGLRVMVACENQIPSPPATLCSTWAEAR